MDVSSAESTPRTGKRIKGRRAVTAIGTTSVSQKMEMMAILYAAFAAWVDVERHVHVHVHQELLSLT